MPTASPQVPPAQVPELVVSPRGAPVDAEVTVSMDGLRAGEMVILGFGSLAAHELVAQVEVNAEGAFVTTVKIPYWAELDRPHFFFWALADQRPRGFSDAFHVTARDGTARIAGTIAGPVSDPTGGATDCVALRGPAETVYMLQGAIGGWAPGTRVRVIGTVAGDPACSGEGLPISVREIEPL